MSLNNSWSNYASPSRDNNREIGSFDSIPYSMLLVYCFNQIDLHTGYKTGKSYGLCIQILKLTVDVGVDSNCFNLWMSMDIVWAINTVRCDMIVFNESNCFRLDQVDCITFIPLVYLLFRCSNIDRHDLWIMIKMISKDHHDFWYYSWRNNN